MELFQALRSKLRGHKYSVALDDFGFELHDGEELVVSLRWNQVKQVVAYKRDSFTTDDVCLEITDSGGQEWLVCEWVENFWGFVNALEVACHIPPLWRGRVLRPPFAENRITIWGARRDFSVTDVA